MNPLQTGLTVLVGVDGSDYALRAVRWAAVEAGRRQLPLRVVHAFAWVVEPDFTTLTGDGHYRDMLIERARKHLDVAAEIAAQVQPGLAVQQLLIVGHPAEVLTAEARQASVLVLGDRGLNRIEGVLVGSTAAAMAMHAACPLVVVRGDELTDESRRTRPVVVGVDDTPSSEAAIGFAFEAAAARDVPLIAVHVYAQPVADPAFGKLIDWAVLAEDERQRLAVRLTGWSETFPEVTVASSPRSTSRCTSWSRCPGLRSWS
jgi:nucleotide-binding universal stress UspA family protein